MPKNYLKKFIKYAKKVYHIEEGLKTLTDARKNPLYTTSEAVLPVLLSFLMRIQSFNELKYKLKSYDFKYVISKKMTLPQVDSIRDMLKVLANRGLYKMHNRIIKNAKQNKVFEESTIDVIVYDALACNSSWINHCKENEVTPVIHVKDNNVISIKEVKARINKSIIKEVWQDEKRACEVKAYEEVAIC